MNPGRLPLPHASGSGSESKGKGGRGGMRFDPDADCDPDTEQDPNGKCRLDPVWGYLSTRPLMERGGDVLVAVPWPFPWR
jgi:hypothetical protein